MGITEIIFSITKAASKLIPSYRRKLNDKLLSACKERRLDRVDDRDNKGNTALIKASRNSAARIVKTLIQAHADVNAKNNEGFTALMRAEKHGYAETVRILREHGGR